MHKLKIAIDYSPKGSIDEAIVELVHFINKLPSYVTTSSCAGRISLYGFHHLQDIHDNNNTLNIDTTETEEHETTHLVSTNTSSTIIPNASDLSSLLPSSTTTLSKSVVTSTKGNGKWIYINHGLGIYKDIQQALNACDPNLSTSNNNETTFAYVTLLVEPFILHTQCQDLESARKLLRIAMDSGYRESGIGIGGKGKIIVAIRSTSGMLEVPIRHNSDNLINHTTLEKLIKIANETYEMNVQRRNRFELLLKKSFSNIVTTVDKPIPSTASTVPSSSTDNSTSSNITCTTCGSSFLSRNLLFKHLIPSKTEINKRICPNQPTEASISDTKSFLCTTCKKSFTSRNALFRHIKMKDKECIVVAKVDEKPTTKIPSEGQQIAKEVNIIMKNFLKKVHIQQESFYQQHYKDNLNQRAIFSPIENTTNNSNISEILHRWGHTSVGISTAIESTTDKVSANGLVVFGGYVGAGIHGRRNDVLLYHEGQWFIPNILSKSANYVPRPRIRHAAVPITIPVSINNKQHNIMGMVMHGGHDGPTKPLHDFWFFHVHNQQSLTSPSLTNAFEGLWNSINISSAGDISVLGRWAHTLATIHLPSDSHQPMLLFGGRNQFQSFNDVHLLTLQNKQTNASALSEAFDLSLNVQELSCSGTIPLPRFAHSSSTITLSTDNHSKVQAMVIYGGFVSPFLYGQHGANTIRFGNDTFHANIDKEGPCMQLLNDIHVLRVYSKNNEYYGIWCQVLTHGIPLQPRFSHSMTNISDSKLVIFGGECYDPGYNHGYLFDCSLANQSSNDETSIIDISIKLLPNDGISYGQYFHQNNNTGNMNYILINSNPYRWRIHPIANLSSEYLPFPMRHSVTYLPSSKANPNGSLILVGGGAVCFAFGSQFSRTCIGNIDRIIEQSVTKEKNNITNNSFSQISDISQLPSVVVTKDKGHWTTNILQSFEFYDTSRTAKLVNTLTYSSNTIPTLYYDNDKSKVVETNDMIAIPILSSALETLNKNAINNTNLGLLQTMIKNLNAGIWVDSPLPSSLRTKSSKQDKIGTTSFESWLGYDDLYTVIEKLHKRKISTTAKIPKLTPRSGTGPKEMETFITIMNALFHECNIPSDKYNLLIPGTEGGIPKRIEWVGDVLMLPINAMTDSVWSDINTYLQNKFSTLYYHNNATAPRIPTHYQIITAPIWDIMAKIFHTTRIGQANIIDTTITRQSKVQLIRTIYNTQAYKLPDIDINKLHNPSISNENLYTEPSYSALEVGTGGWVTIKENNLYYTLDITRVMFSSGNITEKTRMGNLQVNNEVIIDLFSGIGYFTLPLLVKGNAKHVHAVDINPDAIACLRINLQTNNVPTDRYSIWPGNNQTLLDRAPHLRGTADRILLGLIPTSELAWPIAIQLLKPTGGILHIHINKGEEEIDNLVNLLPQIFENLNVKYNHSTHGKLWKGVVLHVEKVKSYAPRVWHYVIDLKLCGE